MIFKIKRYLVGGMVSIFYKDEVYNEAPWFKSKCLRLVDTVVQMLPYMSQLSDEAANNLLNYLYDTCKARDLPAPKESWRNTKVEVLRLYYYIMMCTQFNKTPATILLSKIKVDGKFIVIEDESDGQGGNW